MNTEIEHKFLVIDESYRALATHKRTICQGYLSVDPARTVRIRRFDRHAYLAIKAAAPEGSIARFEWERPITLDDFQALFPHCLAGAIEKVRYIVPIENGLKVEVDEFHGLNEGLVLAEIELPSEDTPFSKPTFLGEDVTSDSRFYNSYLSLHPFTTW